jgi:pimeloyl-ACP methyl ester carboxylesterase
LNRRRRVPADHAAFSALPVTMVTLGGARAQGAVHVSGRLSSWRVPLICVPGYQRNMSDFTEFLSEFGRINGADWPVVLVDLQGRGRSSDRADKEHYGSPRDAHDLSSIATALGIGSAIFLGQGYGGQVVMALAAQRPNLIAGSVLVDAGPVTDTRGIVRLRGNLTYIESLRGTTQVMSGYKRMLSGDHPAVSEGQLGRLALRTHYFDRRGRARPLFDPYLVKALEDFSLDDVLIAQWPLFDALKSAPMLLLRTQLTDQVRRETFEEMVRRRPDAHAMTITGQGSPALLDAADEVSAIARFAREASERRLAA